MANRYQIKCINKPHHQSPVEHITHVGGLEQTPWKITVEDAMRRIETLGEEFFIQTAGLYETKIIVIQATATKRKHIRTVADQTKIDNLLSLPECP